MTDVTRPTPLAELTEALRQLPPLPFGILSEKAIAAMDELPTPEAWAAAILALMPATAEAAALAAAIERLDERDWWRLDKTQYADDAERYMVTVQGPHGIGLGPNVPDAIAAALAATEEEEDPYPHGFLVSPAESARRVREEMTEGWVRGGDE